MTVGESNMGGGSKMEVTSTRIWEVGISWAEVTGWQVTSMRIWEAILFPFFYRYVRFGWRPVGGQCVEIGPFEWSVRTKNLCEHTCNIY
jgi:hypothetical protein